MPLRLLGIRDELTSRPWRPPARHWPGSPLIGGIDEQAGGTWLAVDPDIPRVACLLNARGAFADPARRRSRGDLSLRAAAAGPGFLSELADDLDALTAYDPFHLICAAADSVTSLTWLGSDPEAEAEHPRVRDLAPGTHLFLNAGHTYPVEPGDPEGEPKAAYFAEKFAAARPPADPALPVAQAWGDWLTLAAGDGLDPADPAAIIVRKDLPDGRVYGTTSVTLVAIAADAVRYDFQANPGSADGWVSVPVGSLPKAPHQVGETRRVDVLLGRVEFGEGPPAVVHDAVGGVHGGDIGQGPLLLGDPPEEVVIMLQAERERSVHVGELHVGVDEHLLRRHRHVVPAGLLEEFAAGGGVEVLAFFDAAARCAPVLPLGRRVVVEEQQNPPCRIDRDHPSRQPHRQL